MPSIELPSIQSLKIWLKFGDLALATGTGFLVEKNGQAYLVTNRHNVTGRDQTTGQPNSSHGGVPDNIIIRHNHEQRLGVWIARDEPLYQDEAPRWIEHPVGKGTFDVVLLPLQNTSDCAFHFYDPANIDPPLKVRPSDPISVVGFPFGLETGGALAVWATGFVASEPDLDDPWFLIDCRTRQGQSGSAVIAHRTGGIIALEDGSNVVTDGSVTKLLGVYSGRVNAESDLGIVWKARVISEILDHTA